MFFYVSKIFWFFAEPGNAFLFALILGLFLLATRFRRFGKLLITVCLCGALLVTFVPLGGWMQRALEYRFPVPEQVPEDIDGIIVLGGVVEPRLSQALGSMQFGSAVERITVSAAIALGHPQAKLIYTGGSGSLAHQEFREADYVTNFYERLGVPTGRLILDREARNTLENAKNAFKLADPKPDETWLLITSAFHMPRAVGVFRGVGWETEPYPVDFSTHPTDTFDAPMNFSIGIAVFSNALHEWIGLTAYWLTGKTDAAFPKPRSSEVR